MDSPPAPAPSWEAARQCVACIDASEGDALVVASDGGAFVLSGTSGGAVLSLPDFARGDRLVIERGGDVIELKKLRKGRWRIGASPVLAISLHGRDAETATGPGPPTVIG